MAQNWFGNIMLAIDLLWHNAFDRLSKKAQDIDQIDQQFQYYQKLPAFFAAFKTNDLWYFFSLGC